MSGVIDCGHFRRKTCEVCGFYWDHLIPDFEKMNEFEKMFFLNVEFCPNCHYVNENIDKLSEIRRKDVQSGKYDHMFKSFMPRFGFTTGTDAYPIIVYAKMCENNKEYYTAAIAYFKGAELEEKVLNDFRSGIMYSHKDDDEDARSYNNYIQTAFLNSENCIKKYLSANVDVKAKIFLLGLYKKLNKKDEFNRSLSELVANNKFDKAQIMVLRELKGV